MCGISGIIGDLETSSEKIIKKMNMEQIHRGPDGEGIFQGKKFIFGHRRLSIIDLSNNSEQPMQYLNRFVITYNGEIYNYIELKKDLESLGYKFYTKSDTEVIMAAYCEYGAECLKKFNGMWSFVIYDNLKNNFFISRDRLGIKPLFYSITKKQFIFASEIKAIAKHPSVKLQPNFIYLERFIKNGAREFSKYTAFKGIYKFPHSSYFIGDPLNLKNKKPKTFWNIKFNKSNEKFDLQKAEKFSKKYYEILEDSVRLRLRSDVKVATTLSGGLDSSSIAYIVNKLSLENKSKIKQQTFSIVYKDPKASYCDESSYINKLNYLNIKSNSIEPRKSEYIKESKKIINALENPQDSTLISVWYTYKLVSKHKFKVTLEGQGADELLGGYFSFITRYLADLEILNFLKESKKFLSIPGAIFYVIKAFPYVFMKSIFGKSFANEIAKLFKRIPHKSLNFHLKEDMETRLINLLNYGDRLSMAHSVESRMPFLDYRLIEFVFQLPSCYKLHDGWTKYIARLAFKDKLPKEICWRKDKMGWPSPEQLWFSNGLKNWLKESILDSSFLNLIFNKIKFKKNQDLQYLIRCLNVSLYENNFCWKDIKK